jgi:hypothetical protein
VLQPEVLDHVQTLEPDWTERTGEERCDFRVDAVLVGRRSHEPSVAGLSPGSKRLARKMACEIGLGARPVSHDAKQRKCR